MVKHIFIQRKDFLRALRKLANTQGVLLEILPARGKGGHAFVIYGSRKVSVPASIGRGLFHALCKQLGLTEKDIRR